MNEKKISEKEIEFMTIGKHPTIPGILPRGAMGFLTRIDLLQATDDYKQGTINGMVQIADKQTLLQKYHGESESIPGFLVLDSLLQQAGLYMSWAGCNGKGRAMGVNHVIFPSSATFNDESIHYKLDITRLAKNPRMNLITANGVAKTQSGNVICQVNGLKVGMYPQTEEQPTYVLDEILEEPVVYFSQKPVIHHDSAKAHWDVDPRAWFFRDHFYNDPVMPGCIGVQALWELCAAYIKNQEQFSGNIRINGSNQISFRKEVVPTSTRVEYQLSNMRSPKPETRIANGEVFIDGEKAYTAKDLLISLV